jgi:hypothetical protein
VKSQRDARLLHYKTNMLAKDKIYMGKGLEPDRKCITLPKLITDRFPIVSRGWLQDFMYYQKNTHPVLSMFFASTFNPFNRFERFQLLLIDICVSFVLTLAQLLFLKFVFIGMKFKGDDDNEKEISDNWNQFWTGLLMVTIPMIIVQRSIKSLSSAWAVRDESSAPKRGCVAQ